MPSRREDFLLEMYRARWDDIARAEDSMWKFIAFYSAILASSTIAFEKGLIIRSGAITLLLLFGFLAILVALNRNLWFVRNLGLVSNLEKEFLNIADYGVLIPHYFKEKERFHNWEIYWLQIAVYFIVNLIILILYIRIPSEPIFWKYIVCAIFIFCTLFSIYYWCKQKRIYNIFIEDAKGRKNILEK